MVDHLLSGGHHVVGVDNFSTGKRRFLEPALQNERFRLVERDLYSGPPLTDVLEPDFAAVIHLAANADVRFGLDHPRRDLEQNTLVTSNVLEAMRQRGVKMIAFSSTGSVYGEAPVTPTPEDCPFPVQTSLYAASKLAAEGLIQAYAEGYGMRAVIFRFVSILGERYQHGHVLDFMAKLEADPARLPVLGNGLQRKSYLYIGDCLRAISMAMDRGDGNKVEVYNLGTDEVVNVNQSIDVICAELGVSPRREYSGGERGWVGDNPLIQLDCRKIRSLGWRPTRTIRESVQATVRYLKENAWLLKEARL
jgi:UDP-glucose 4-epimerase